MPENIILTDILSGGTNSLRTEITNTPAVTNANINITLSALRDAITKTGETVKTLADVVDKLSDVGITSLPSLVTGSNIVGKVGIDQTTGGTTNGIVNKNASGTEIFTDASPGSMKLTGSRGAVIAHRTAITAADKVPAITITAADQPAIPVSGGTLTAVSHGIGVAPGNSYGSAGVSALVTVTPTVNKSIDINIPQVVGAEYYDIFLSTSTTAPLWVARVTETQRATGCAITAVATVGAGGSAGVVNVQVVGTGLASTSAPFVANNAYIPTGITAISCAGKTKAYIYLDLTVTDLRSVPTIEINPFMQNNDSESTKWFQIESQAIAIMNGATGQPLPQVFVVDVNSARNLIVLVGTISGQGTSVNITVELF